MFRRPAVVSTVIVSVLVAAGLALCLTPRVSAQDQASASMLITATVIRKCVVTTAPLNFGNYDPVQTHATAPLDGQSTITVACTKGTVVSIGINDGTNNRGNDRRMQSGFRDFLTYELYKDQNRTQRWGDNSSGRYDGGVAPSRDPRSFIVYGRVPGGQDVDLGVFQDTVVVTVHF